MFAALLAYLALSLRRSEAVLYGKTSPSDATRRYVPVLFLCLSWDRTRDAEDADRLTVGSPLVSGTSKFRIRSAQSSTSNVRVVSNQERAADVVTTRADT